MLNFTPIIVAILGIVLLSEKPTHLQWFGTTLFIVGIVTYFFPVSLIDNQALGLLVMAKTAIIPEFEMKNLFNFAQSRRKK